MTRSAADRLQDIIARIAAIDIAEGLLHSTVEGVPRQRSTQSCTTSWLLAKRSRTCPTRCVSDTAIFRGQTLQECETYWRTFISEFAKRRCAARSMRL